MSNSLTNCQMTSADMSIVILQDGHVVSVVSKGDGHAVRKKAPRIAMLFFPA
jgi:hypothetical protein